VRGKGKANIAGDWLIGACVGPPHPAISELISLIFQSDFALLLFDLTVASKKLKVRGNRLILRHEVPLLHRGSLIRSRGRRGIPTSNIFIRKKYVKLWLGAQAANESEHVRSQAEADVRVPRSLPKWLKLFS